VHDLLARGNLAQCDESEAISPLQALGVGAAAVVEAREQRVDGEASCVMEGVGVPHEQKALGRTLKARRHLGAKVILQLGKEAGRLQPNQRLGQRPARQAAIDNIAAAVRPQVELLLLVGMQLEDGRALSRRQLEECVQVVHHRVEPWPGLGLALQHRPLLEDELPGRKAPACHQ